MSNEVPFKPTDSWRWYFDKEYDCLMLEIADDMLFRSRYSGHMLIPDAFQSFPFSVGDATAYYEFYDSCSRLDLTEPQKIELSLNAIVAANFLKPQMPKSWYFAEQSKPYMPQAADIVIVYQNENNEKLDLMVVEPGVNASVCVIAQPRLVLKNKTLILADVIKVMNDRLVLKKARTV